MTDWSTIGVKDDVKDRLERIKRKHEGWNAFMLRLLERYENTSEDDSV